ncbi:hypothetical protein ACW6B4_003236 [Yersinia ruckeri]|nr:hypothetical protein NJ56_18280 [Yersinia ruckeri]
MTKLLMDIAGKIMNQSLSRPTNTDMWINYFNPFLEKYFQHYGRPVKKDFLKKLESIYVENDGDYLWFIDNYDVLRVHYLPFIFEAALKKWLEYHYKTYPHPTRKERDRIVAGKVSSVDEWSVGKLFQWSKNNDFRLFNALKLESGKKLQIIKLEGISEFYYVVWSNTAKGIQKYNVIDFYFKPRNEYLIITKKSIDGHSGGFGQATPVMVNAVYYPSIIMAYRNLQPGVSYSTVCQRLNRKLPPEQAFSSERQQHGNIDKRGIKVKMKR